MYIFFIFTFSFSLLTHLFSWNFFCAEQNMQKSVITNNITKVSWKQNQANQIHLFRIQFVLIKFNLHKIILHTLFRIAQIYTWSTFTIILQLQTLYFHTKEPQIEEMSWQWEDE